LNNDLVIAGSASRDPAETAKMAKNIYILFKKSLKTAVLTIKNKQNCFRIKHLKHKKFLR